MGRNRNESKATQATRAEWEFDNPTAEGNGGEDDPPDPDPESPRSPKSPLDLAHSFDMELELQSKESEFKRGWLNYTVFMTVMIPLIPAYGLFALLMGWACWVLPNPISVVAMVVSALLPWVLWLGVKGARRKSMPRLQLFSFMMMLAISLQVSLVLVMILDDGTMSVAYISSVTLGFSSLCEETAALPVGAADLPITGVCECLMGDGSGVVNASMVAGLASVASDPNVVQCSRAVLERELGVEGSDFAMFAVVTLAVEFGLSWLAYHMMEDLDAAAIKVEAARLGGIQLGTLKGEIVRGSSLGLAEQSPKKKNQKQKKPKGLLSATGLRKKQGDTGGGLASRYAVITVRTEELFDPSRKVQNRTTNIIEDDADPEWNCLFGLAGADKVHRAAGIDIFEKSSKKIEIKVFDGDKLSAADKRDKKKMKKARVPVCVGQVGELQQRTGGVEFIPGVQFAENSTTRAGTLPTFDYEMDGESEVDIPLFREKEKGSGGAERAGSITVRLSYTPRRMLAARSAATITKSWYFEATVIGMCLLAMVALGLRAPADPPSPTLYAALRITELFVATHMVVELLLEVEGTIAAGDKFLTEGWFLLAMFVVICNWISILMPPDSDMVVQSAPSQSATTDMIRSSMENQHLAGALANQNIRKLISVGRVFRIVRPIRTLRLIPHVDMIVSTLQDSMTIFGTVCLLIVFLLAILSLVGISSFGGALQYECIEADMNGDYICTEGQQRAAEDSNVGARGSIECPIRCPSTLACAETHEWCAPLEEARAVGSDSFGYRNFDNFGSGILSVFVQMTGTGGLHTLPIALEQAEAAAPTRGWAISLTISLLLNLIALNLFLAVCCSAYSDVACKEMELEEALEMLREKEKEEAIANETEEETAAREQAEAIEFEESKPYIEKLAEKDWSNSHIAPVRDAAKRIVLSEMFESATSFVILGNTVTMAMAHEGMPEEWRYWLGGFETFFLIMYVLEALVTVLASGTHLYFASASNRFDCFVICCSAIGFFATFFADELRAMVGDAGDGVGILQVLRGVRLLRALQVVRLLHRKKALIHVMRTIFKAWRPLLYHSIFCVFSMSTFAIIGMHMFGGSLGPGVSVDVYEEMIPEHYETFWNGLRTCFEMTVGEDWSSSMWYYMKMGSVAYGYPAVIVAGFFVVMYIWMSGILFSLYVAMLLQNFATLEKEKLRLQQRVYDRKAVRNERAAARARRKLRHSLLEQTIVADKSKGAAFGKKGIKHLLHHAAATCKDIDAAENKSLYLFRLNSHIRIVAATVQDHRLFKRIVMILIVFSCSSLAIEGRGHDAGSAPTIAGQQVPSILGFGLFSILNVLVLGAFIFEAGLKVVIHGFIFKSGPTPPYLASRMNQLDFVIVVACLAAYMPFVPIEGPWARALRLGRVITPISNSLAKHPDIAVVVLSFFRAAPDTAIVLLPLGLLALVFSIVGVAWFGGKTRVCVNLANSLEALPYDEQTCLNMTEHGWVSQPFNFDNSANGMALLFVATTDGTHSFMLLHNAISDGWSGTAFWVAYHLVFTCFFLNLFLGVLTASFEKNSGAALRTNGENSWIGFKRFIQAFRPEKDDEEELRPRPSKFCQKCCGTCMAVPWFKFRNRMFELAIDKRLEKFWGAAILANTFTLATDRFPIPQWQVEAVDTANKLFLLLCFIEVCTKLFGFGSRHFFSQGWYVSDFVLVTVSLFLRFTGGQSGIEALRVVRVFRIVVLASKIPALVQLIDVLVRCLQASLAVIILTLLALYIYSVMGMNLFGGLPSDEALATLGFPESKWEELRGSPDFVSEVCPSCIQYSDNSNFRDFLSSVRLLVQLVYGESLATYVRELQFMGGSFWVLMIFFASFYSLTVWIFMNLLIVTVLSNFDSASAEPGGGTKAITMHDIEGFTHTWAALTIGVHQVPSMHQSSESLLDRLKHTLEHHEENGEHGVESAVHEDGPPELCGQLTITVEKVTGLEEFKDTARPYCAVTIRGSDSKGTHTQLTESRRSKNGTASWKKEKGSQPGAILRFHATGYHEECEIELIDSCKFGDRRLGSVFLNFGDNIEMENLRGGCTNPRKVVLETAISPADLGNLSGKPTLGDPDRWDRFAMDGEEDDGVEEDEEDPAAEMTHQDEDSTQVSTMDAAQRKLEEKRQRKDQNKLRKQLANNSKGSNHGAKRSSSAPQSPGAGVEGLATVCPEGWQRSGIKLHITALWEPKRSETPTLSFLADHRVLFAHKEGSCGAEGWLDVSQEGSMFKRRFCYVQAEPAPAFKFYRNCQTHDELERAGLRNKLQVATVRGTSLLSICRGFKNNGMARKNRKAANFEIEFDKVQNNSRQKTLVKIGQISGTVLSAVGLKKPAAKGVQLLQLLQPMDSAGVPAPFEELSHDEATPEQATAPLDDPNQLPNTGPAKYMALKTTKVRQSSALDSMEVARLERYHVVTVTHTVEVEDTVMLRTRVGWVSLTSSAGWPIMVGETNRNRYYRVKREAPVGNSARLSECNADVSSTSMTVPKGVVVEVLESQHDPEADTIRHRIADGWVSERDFKSTPPPEFSCEVEITAWKPSAEQEEDQPLLATTSTPQQVFRTGGLVDTLSPVWSEAFAMNIYASSLTLHVRVLDETSETEIGCAQLSIGSDGVPGPTLTESSEGAELDTPQDRSTALPAGSFTSMNVQLYEPVKNDGEGAQATRTHAGSVQLRIMYTEMFSREEQLLPLQRDAAVAGDLCTSVEMICNQTKQVKWRFQAANPSIARQWCAALRWVADGCLAQERPCRLDIDLPPLLPREMVKATRDISLIDLPFSRATALLQGLYHRRVMGSHKPTLRYSVYAIFQLETHAWGQSKGGAQGASRMRQLTGSYIADLRGLNFYNVLERLALLHYGKRRCLSYENQVAEYQSEIEHVALQTMQCAVAAWVFRHRVGKTVGGQPWPWHAAWRTTHPATYLQASEALCATRFRSLGILRGEIERYSRPKIMRVSTVRAAKGSPASPLGSPTSNGNASPQKRGVFSRLRRGGNGRTNGTKTAVAFGSIVDAGTGRKDTGGLSEEMRSEITELWGERGALDAHDEELRLMLAQIFSEDEHTFVVTAALLEELGGVQGELSLDDLLVGMDRMLTKVDAPDDVVDDLDDDCDSDLEDIINAAERPPELALRSLVAED